MEKESCSKSDNYEVASGDALEEGNMNPMIIEKRPNLLTSRAVVEKFQGCCCRCIAKIMSMESTIDSGTKGMMLLVVIYYLIN